MTQGESEFQVGDTLQLRPWGRLTNEEIAQRGIEVLMGMVRGYHAECREPNHFWCDPLPSTVFVVAELYQSSSKQGEGYIGCYLRGADFDQSGAPILHEKPFQKILMQPLTDGRVLVHLGRVTEDESGRVAMGLLDQRTVEYTIVTPRAVPNITASDGPATTFVIQRTNGVWAIALCLQPIDGSGTIQARLIGSLQVDPKPSPLTKLSIGNSPAGRP